MVAVLIWGRKVHAHAPCEDTSDVVHIARNMQLHGPRALLVLALVPPFLRDGFVLLFQRARDVFDLVVLIGAQHNSRSLRTITTGRTAANERPPLT